MPLPKSLKEFGDEKYWDDFFRASKGQAFEWYGSWADLPQLLQLHCGLRPDQQPPLQILVVGCGNSALSAHMYDAGFTSIVNVDFNRRVITEMLRLHVRARPLMRWLVMDITALQVFSFALCSLSLSLSLSLPIPSFKTLPQTLNPSIKLRTLNPQTLAQCW